MISKQTKFLTCEVKLGAHFVNDKKVMSVLDFFSVIYYLKLKWSIADKNTVLCEADLRLPSIGSRRRPSFNKKSDLLFDSARPIMEMKAKG